MIKYFFLTERFQFAILCGVLIWRVGLYVCEDGDGGVVLVSDESKVMSGWCVLFVRADVTVWVKRSMSSESSKIVVEFGWAGSRVYDTSGRSWNEDDEGDDDGGPLLISWMRIANGEGLRPGEWSLVESCGEAEWRGGDDVVQGGGRGRSSLCSLGRTIKFAVVCGGDRSVRRGDSGSSRWVVVSCEDCVSAGWGGPDWGWRGQGSYWEASDDEKRFLWWCISSELIISGSHRRLCCGVHPLYRWRCSCGLVSVYEQSLNGLKCFGE